MLFFLCKKSVLHPETRQPVLFAGCVYPRSAIKANAQIFGFDYVEATVIIADSYDEACNIAKSLPKNA